jgi:hypothetical protein
MSTPGSTDPPAAASVAAATGSVADPPSPAADPPSAARASSESPVHDLVAGGVFVVFGLAFAIGARGYELGTALDMGPGYYPLVLGGLLVILGVGVMVKGVIARIAHRDEEMAGAADVTRAPSAAEAAGAEAAVAGAAVAGAAGAQVDDDPHRELADDERGKVPWLALVLVLGAIVGFAFAVVPLGLVPAVFGTALLAALAGYRTKVLPAIGVAAGLTVLCYLVFVLLLQLRLPLFGTVFTG